MPEVEYVERNGFVYDEETDEIVFCSAIATPAVYYLSNGDPGYPEEYCDNEATHIGSDGFPYCRRHTAPEDYPEDRWEAMGIDTWQEYRDYMGEDD